jgi:hypothetical protein
MRHFSVKIRIFSDILANLLQIFPKSTSQVTTASSSSRSSDICKEFRSEDDVRSYMNELMQKSMISTGMNTSASLPRSQQNVIAGRINKVLEGLSSKMVEEMGRMEGGIGL